MELPPAIRDLDHLEALLSEPSTAAIEALRRVDGDILILGVAGKMGPTLARMARRALDAVDGARRVIGVSRFSSSAQQTALERRVSRRFSATFCGRTLWSGCPMPPRDLLEGVIWFNRR